MLHNIVTIYRFNTPFLDIEKEKESLIKIKDKLIKFIENEIGNCDIKTEDLVSHIRIIADFKLLKMHFSYIKKFDGNYYSPIFKMDLFLDNRFIINNEQKKKTVNFLTSFFEIFDGVNEKEYLIDIDNSAYYTSSLLKRKNYPVYQFNDIVKIQNDFEKNKGEELLENFINTYKNKDFILTKENANIYHKLHGIILYYIYLVYIMHKNIIKSKEQLNELGENSYEKTDFESQKELIQKRLSYVQELNIANFKAYYTKLETLFGLIK